MEICYHDYLFSISIFGYVFVSICCAESLYRKTSVGETHHDVETKFEWEIHELWKVVNQGPRMMKWASSNHHGGPPGLSLCRLNLRFVHGQV
jgi:hypothetical protein